MRLHAGIKALKRKTGLAQGPPYQPVVFEIDDETVNKHRSAAC